MPKYLYTIKIPIDTIDDVGARMEVSRINRDPAFYIHKGEQKLQEIKDNEPPRKVEI